MFLTINSTGPSMLQVVIRERLQTHLIYKTWPQPNLLKPKFHYANFHRNFPWGKSWTQIMKVADTNHFNMFATKSVTSPRQTRLCRSNEIQPVTTHGESQRQSQRQSLVQIRGKVADLSQTQIMNVGDVICVADFHDLCPRQVRNFVANLSQTLSQTRRNGIWV